MSKKKCRELFSTFFKIGAFTFGGGYAMIPMIKKEIVEEKKWLTDNDIFDIVAISESTPGPLAINCATFVGSKIAGTKGALAATTGVVLPSFAAILLISQILLKIEQIEVVRNAFQGIRAGVLVLIGAALITMFRQMKKDYFTYFVLIAALILMILFKVHTIFLLFICAVAGVVRTCYLGKKDGK